LENKDIRVTDMKNEEELPLVTPANYCIRVKKFIVNRWIDKPDNMCTTTESPQDEMPVATQGGRVK
jgi:hypothetical protein